MNTFHNPGKRSGFSMVEVLVTLIILLVGLLGLAGLHIQAQRSQTESYQRVQALILLDDMVGRLNANRGAASCYAFVTNGMGTVIPFLGTGAAPVPACTTGTGPTYDFAKQDLQDWSNLLAGAAEVSGGSSAIVGARGCVSYVGPADGSGIYTITVAWQGLGNTAEPPASLSCGAGLYGSETKRRVVSVTLRIATLS